MVKKRWLCDMTSSHTFWTRHCRISCTFLRIFVAYESSLSYWMHLSHHFHHFTNLSAATPYVDVVDWVEWDLDFRAFLRSPAPKQKDFIHKFIHVIYPTAITGRVTSFHHGTYLQSFEFSFLFLELNHIQHSLRSGELFYVIHLSSKELDNLYRVTHQVDY